MRRFVLLCKNIFLVLLAMYILPRLFIAVVEQYKGYFEPTFKIGVIDFPKVLQYEDYLHKIIQPLFEDSAIKAVVLRISAPAKLSASTQSTFDTIIHLKTKFLKPVVAVAEDCCVGGAYYVAASADKVVVTRSATVGGLDPAACVVCHDTKDLDSTAQEPSGAQGPPDEEQLFSLVGNKSEVDALRKTIFEQVVLDICRVRGLQPDAVRKWSNGQLFVGEKAKELGLVDAIGPVFVAEELLKEMAAVDGNPEFVDVSDKCYNAWLPGFKKLYL